MSWSKKVSCGYFRIEAAEEDYFSKFYDNMATILQIGNTSGIFEGGQLKYLWKVHGQLDMDGSAVFLISLAKEKPGWPCWLTEEGELNEITLPNGVLGHVEYGIVCPAYKFLVCTGPAANFKKLLGQFSPEGVVRLNPLFDDNVSEKVLNWDCFQKFSFSINLPTGEDLTEYTKTKAGELTKLIEFLGGLKLDISVSSGSGKELLSNMMVKDLMPELLANDLCKSLTIKGSDFEGDSKEQIDLKNAQIKYSEMLEIEGNYITESDAKQVLMRAINDKGSRLFSEND